MVAKFERHAERLIRFIDAAFPDVPPPEWSYSSGNVDLVCCARYVEGKTWRQLEWFDLARVGECIIYWEREVTLYFIPGLVRATLTTYLADGQWGDAFLNFIPKLPGLVDDCKARMTPRQLRLLGTLGMFFILLARETGLPYKEELPDSESWSVVEAYWNTKSNA